MNEFALIDTYFKPNTYHDAHILLGIGDDAACLSVPTGYDLVVSTDTLVADVHFCTNWDAFDIAWKALMVNLSDIAAMGATPYWVSLALTLPVVDKLWLKRFAQGLHAGCQRYNVSLIGGDTTKGPLTLTITVQGLVPHQRFISRKHAQIGDGIWVSGMLGGAALAVEHVKTPFLAPKDQTILNDLLMHPRPRVNLAPILQDFASAAIDVSDGLGADLLHICQASHTGALLQLENLPIHPLVQKYKPKDAIPFALNGGDDYELCFTVPYRREAAFKTALAAYQIPCTRIGEITEHLGLQGQQGLEIKPLIPQGYQHF
ncbi:MAG: thiamine-phosphate kinase [Legionellaceae bacterium]|nr:thiamine-phosphate kinase [Legionellaceae bacterium]HCA89206.1 thiamine-phosphate kinase [Legionellales bacterium]|tara:strand:- start:546 stop:1496 length:951 start_codon:yes stop_codon:yes gene_type:complete